MKGCRPLRIDEIGKVLAALPLQRDRALFGLGLTTGLRIGELLAIRVKQLFDGRWQESIVVPRRTLKGQPEGRVLPLHPRARELCDIHVHRTIRRFGPDAYLFGPKHRKDGERALSRREAQIVLKDAYTRAGLTGPLSTHTMRKTFAAQVHEALGRDINRTREALGHRYISTTVAYLSFDRAEIDTAVLGITW